LFARASVFAEGGDGASRGTLAAMDEMAVAEKLRFSDGYDLKSADLDEFFRRMQAACRAGRAALCLTAPEQAFYEDVFLPARGALGPRFVVLGWSFLSRLDHPHSARFTELLVGHEALHAQYFLQPAFRDAVDGYWRGLPDGERAAVRKALGDAGYDSSNDAVMRNEFQAYVLEPGAGRDSLASFVPAHRAALERLCALRGVRILRVRAGE
jgi:hypothetical protein